MIRALVNLYDKLNEQGLVERLGWSGSKVLYGIELNEDGKPTSVVPLDYKVKPGKKGEKESSMMRTIAKKELIYNSFYYIINLR